MNPLATITYESRAARWEDIPVIVDLYNALMIAQWGYPDWTVEDANAEFGSPGVEITEYARLWFDESGKAIAAGFMYPLPEPPVRVRAFPCVDPTHPDFHQIGLTVLQWLEGQARRLALPFAPEQAKVQMIGWTYATHAPTVALYTAYGMEHIRRFLAMEIELSAELPAPELPGGVTIRTLRYPHEAREAYRISDVAFSDHYGHLDDPEMKNFDRWAHRKFSASDFDPSLWFVAEVDGEIAGFAWCHLGMPEDPTLGWVDTLGVLPAYRRRGLAVLLLHHAFREFQTRGMHKAGLGVDASSLTGATRVYERAGMHCVGEWDTYSKVLRVGIELARE